MIWVTQATALPDYRLAVSFSDASSGVVDLREMVFSDPRPIVAALQSAAVFAAIRVDADTVVWDNGFDLAPEYLYAHLNRIVEPVRPTEVSL